MTPDPKPQKPYRDKKYLEFVRSLRCTICWRQAEVHHIRRSYWGAGMGVKSHDFVAVARCRDHHSPDYEDDVEMEIINNLIKYLAGREREVIEALMKVCAPKINLKKTECEGKFYAGEWCRKCKESERCPL